MAEKEICTNRNAFNIADFVRNVMEVPTEGGRRRASPVPEAPTTTYDIMQYFPDRVIDSVAGTYSTLEGAKRRLRAMMEKITNHANTQLVVAELSDDEMTMEVRVAATGEVSTRWYIVERTSEWGHARAREAVMTGSFDRCMSLYWD